MGPVCSTCAVSNTSPPRDLDDVEDDILSVEVDVVLEVEVVLEVVEVVVVVVLVVVVGVVGVVL